MNKKPDFSRKILKILSEKQAISLPELSDKLHLAVQPPSDVLGGWTAKSTKKPAYALTRSLKGLKKAGLIEALPSGQGHFARLTKFGRIKASSQKLEASSSLLNPNWDGKWRIILLDLPEERKAERESLRYLLKKAGFILLKNSAWISPHPFEYLFTNIKKDLGFTTELVIIVTEFLDPETEKAVLTLGK